MKTLDDVPESVRRSATRLRDGLVDLLGDDLTAVWLYGAPLFGPPFLDIDLHLLLNPPPPPPPQEGPPRPAPPPRPGSATRNAPGRRGARSRPRGLPFGRRRVALS